VADLRARFPDKDIEVDGGVGPKTIDSCAEAGTLIVYFRSADGLKSNTCIGSNVIVAGTAIFGAENPEEVISVLKIYANRIIIQ